MLGATVEVGNHLWPGEVVGGEVEGVEVARSGCAEVPERTIMGVMGWSSTSMAARYQDVSDPIRQEVASRVGGLLWSRPETN